MLLILETFDGFFQSMGWSSIVRANALIQKNDKERDRSSTILGCSYQVGNSLAWVVSAFAVAWWGWQAGFWVASVFLLSRGVTLYLTKPKLDHKPIQTIKKQVKGTLSFPIVMSGVSLMILNMVRYGVLTWLFTYYVFAGNHPIAEFGEVSIKSFLIFIPLAGVCGTIVYNKLPWKKDLTSMQLITFISLNTPSPVENLSSCCPLHLTQMPLIKALRTPRALKSWGKPSYGAMWSCGLA